jgi:xylan 1,4-beta-xylosidase
MNGQRSFGRCTLISPVEWKDNGWPALSADWPEGCDEPVVIELPLSDEFSGNKLGLQWQSLEKLDIERYSFKNGHLEVEAMGEKPGTSYPLTLNPRHPSYEVETELQIEGDVTAGLILFYSSRAYVSFGLSHEGRLLKHVKRSQDGPFVRPRDRITYSGKRIKLRMRNDRQDASAYYLDPDGKWIKLEQSEDISGFQHNIYGGFVSVRPGIFVMGEGKASFNYFRYRDLSSLL